MATLTPILGLSKPIVGADDDVWGGMWNANADILDGLVKPIDLAPYLLKAGGVMTGFLTLSANATNALHAVPLQQMQTGLATKIGDAPNDGGYYARRNLGWEPSPGSAINQDAPSDGFAYGRRNASWDKTLRLAGGVVTGPTTIMGSLFTTKGNIAVGIAEPLNMSTATALDGGSIRAWYTVANNYMSSMYYDGTNYRRLNATVAPSQIIAGSGGYSFQSAAVGAADSTIPTLTQLATITPLGISASNYMLPDCVSGMFAGNRALVSTEYAFNVYWSTSANAWKRREAGGGIVLYCNFPASPTLEIMGTPSGAAGSTAALQSYASFGNSGLNLAGALTGVTTITASGNINATSGTITGSNVYANSYLYSAGNGRADGDWYAGALLYSNNGRVQARVAGNACLSMWSTNAGCNGFWNDTNNVTYWGICDGNGYPQAGKLSFNTNGDIWTGGAVTSAYMHSTGSLDVDSNITGGRIRATNGSMNTNGNFFVADNEAYRLQRESWSGNWVFYENNTWNFQVRTTGDCESRGVLYSGTHVFSRGGVYAANAWDFYIAAGGAGRLLQFAGNWYLQWNGSNGELAWYANGGWMMGQRTSDWLCWNGTGPVGGYGAYQNFSDARGKTDITHTEIGLPEVMKIKPARFRRTIKPELSIGRKRPDGGDVPDFIPRSEIGFIAQELQEALPEAVVEVADFVDGEARLMMTLDPIVAALVNAVKTLNGRLVKLEGRHK